MARPKKTHDVAILGWWYGKNYGSILTYYGLHQAIKSLGHTVLMVHEPLGYNGYRVEWPDDILSLQFARRVGYDYTEQRHFSENVALNDRARAFVVGSDQLWNPLIGRVNDDLFLDFVASENTRVAYGTSFGNRSTDKFTPEFIAKHAANLQAFKAISVREDYGVEIAKDVFGARASLVVDPVFLLPKSHYESLADKATAEPPQGEYMTVFFLDPTPEKKRVALAVASKLGFEKIYVVPNPDEREPVADLFEDQPHVVVMAESSPENFLRAYRDSSYVVTDSFHGSAFATIFEKPFSSIYNTKRGADRFQNLLTVLGFGEDRRVFDADVLGSVVNNSMVTRNVDFTDARKYIEQGRASSMKWLKDALDAKTKGSAALDPSKKVVPPGVVVAAPAVKRFATRQPTFATVDKGWQITSRKGVGTKLRVAHGRAVAGNPVWLDLPGALTKGARYRLKIDWSVHTTSPHVNVHLRDPKTGRFSIVGTVDCDSRGKRSAIDVIEFTVPETNLSQIMLGGIHFAGRGGGAEVRSVELDMLSAPKSPSTAAKPRPAPKSTPPAKPKTPQHTKRITPTPGPDTAIPPKTPDREQIILDVINNPRVQDLKERVLDLGLSLPLYVGRELKEYTHNRVGGPADLMALPRTIEDLQRLVQFAIDNDVPYRVLGRGSNVLVRDGGLRGLVIITTGLNYFHLANGLFTAGAGASFIEATYYLLEHGLSTLEWASGIPGTVGGAVFMNAGTNVSDIRATIRSVKYLDGRGEIKELRRDQIAWGKRYTTFQDHPDWIILEATFETSPADKSELSKMMLGTVQVRERHFPLENPNHGSTFKWWRAPRLIMQAGLTGYQIGGVQISTKQPGFFVNVDRATASDYEALINFTIAKVYEYSGFLMEPEVEIIGERPHTYERYDVDSPMTDLEKKSVGPQA